MDEKAKHTMLLTQLIIMLHSAAMQQMGKLKSPVSDSIERDLQAAQNTIDLLDMLLAKTTGNLSPDEARLLQDVVKEVKLNYVDEAAKGDTPKADAKPN